MAILFPIDLKKYQLMKKTLYTFGVSKLMKIGPKVTNV